MTRRKWQRRPRFTHAEIRQLIELRDLQSAPWNERRNFTLTATEWKLVKRLVDFAEYYHPCENFSELVATA